MHTTVRYTGSRAERLVTAFYDACEWLQPRQQEAIFLMANEKKTPREMFKTIYFAMGFTGMSGLPCRAYARYVIREIFSRRGVK